MKQIKVFGDKAEYIKNGQIFKAKVESVDGRKVVILEPQEICDTCSKVASDEYYSCSHNFMGYGFQKKGKYDVELLEN